MSRIIFQIKNRVRFFFWLAIMSLTAVSPAQSKSSFTLFESGYVRPWRFRPTVAISLPSTRRTTGSRSSKTVSMA